jgi:hypothetical protein
MSYEPVSSNTLYTYTTAMIRTAIKKQDIEMLRCVGLGVLDDQIRSRGSTLSCFDFALAALYTLLLLDTRSSAELG